MHSIPKPSCWTAPTVSAHVMQIRKGESGIISLSNKKKISPKREKREASHAVIPFGICTGAA